MMRRRYSEVRVRANATCACLKSDEGKAARWCGEDVKYAATLGGCGEIANTKKNTNTKNYHGHWACVTARPSEEREPRGKEAINTMLQDGRSLPRPPSEEREPREGRKPSTPCYKMEDLYKEDEDEDGDNNITRLY